MTDLTCRLYAAHDLRIEELPEPQAAPESAIIRVQRGGICGSDLHYYHKGGFGPVRVREPIILGHEAAGLVESAPENCGLRPGQLVALCPSRPCNTCAFCLSGKQRHCLNMRFNGSAMRLPHEDGFFRSRIAHPVVQCLPIEDGTDAQAAAWAEPLAVCLHALRLAPSLEGQKVLVTGTGPIGAICIALARLKGADEIVATDVQDFTLGLARQMGADRIVNVISETNALNEYAAGKGQFDVVLECSANPQAIAHAIDLVRPQGTILQIGVGGSTDMPLNLIVGKELRFLGTHRFDAEFADAVRMIGAKEIDLSPLVTHVLPVTDGVRAFDIAGDRTRAVKVQIDFEL
ncbi:L-idonate 5-dehydrogenase [Natronohydrobacter thiooxidans]|uniref:L-idonate 5-dehydrogenase n=1 Tax=Natronohydrobacter thiooxidans TaxID=87172 RepID=UPI0008FF6B6B|nr:L-idonate 5-dehydrogenase [Natronohydrobacter thiooxidans]